MGRVLGFVGLLIAMAIGFYIYGRSTQSVTPRGAGSPQAAIDVTGVKGDLLAMANAERNHYELQGKYVSLDELHSAGDLSVVREGRGPYRYSADISDSGFRIIATYSGPAGATPATISIDQTMRITP
jgi:hypothetical protein